METSVKAAEVLVPPQPEVTSTSRDADHTEGAACGASRSSDDDSFVDPMVEFGRRLEDIISAHGSAASALDKQLVEEAKEDVAAAMEKEVSQLRQNLKKLSSPEQKLEDLLRRYAELAVLRRCDEKKLCVLQAESRSSVAARSKLETLCRELQGHYRLLREETFKRCKEDEEKRTEMTNHFQTMLTEIQAQIEQHSTRNDKLCQENTNLTSKLESLMNQCELREQSLENINKRRDLQQKLTEAKLQQADALLTEAEEKHKREKEYLLREAIDKTKKCFAMKEQELAMKKKLLVQAAEWKLQAQTLREQETVMQAQLALYAQKFDEFQGTLAKSNEIYARFKKEMENMSDKMKKMEKESNVWKTRFENCNKALTDMIEERTEKGKEYDVFVLKIQKLEKLCRALQDERVILYEKIKEVRSTNASIPLRVFGSSNAEDTPNAEGEDISALLTPVEVEKIQEEDPVLTEDMTRLREEQTKLQEFAASLFAAPSDDEEEHNDEVEPEEDVVASAFSQFKSRTQAKEQVVPVPEQEVEEKPVLPQPEKVEEVPAPVVSPSEAPTPADAKPEAVKVETRVEDKDVPPVKPVEEIQQQPAEQVTTSEPEKVEINPPTDLKPEAAEAQISVEAAEVKPVTPVEEEQVQAEPVKEPEEAPTQSESAPASKNTPKATADSSKKQTPKKKKKRNTKNAS